MKIFLDSADIDEITALSDTGFIDGITTNPSLIAKSGHKIADQIAEICAVIDGPVSAEVTALIMKQCLLKAGNWRRLRQMLR